jgi:fructokinase
MMHYHVYAVGNALVDMEYTVEDEFFRAQGIDKGVMTLVDAQSQENTIQALHAHSVKRGCGGSAANTIIAVQQFGGQGYYACKVADDELGHFFADDLKHTGVHTNLDPANLESHDHTGRCLVMVTPDAERTMHTYLGISEHVSTKEVSAQAIAAAEYVYLEGYLVTSETGRDAAIQTHALARAQNTRVAMTFSDPNMVTFFREGLTEMAGERLDLLFCNEQEAYLWSETDNLQDAVECLKKTADQFVITLGARGALLFDGERAQQLPGKQVTPKDSNGAGDLFAGAFLYALTHGHSFTAAGELAIAASAELVTAYGPRLTAEQQQTIFQEWQAKQSDTAELV